MQLTKLYKCIQLCSGVPDGVVKYGLLSSHRLFTLWVVWAREGKERVRDRCCIILSLSLSVSTVSGPITPLTSLPLSSSTEV